MVVKEYGKQNLLKVYIRIPDAYFSEIGIR